MKPENVAMRLLARRDSAKALRFEPETAVARLSVRKRDCESIVDATIVAMYGEKRTCLGMGMVHCVVW